MMKKLGYVVLVTGTVLIAANAVGPKTFGSPEEARDALIQAAAQGGGALIEFFGPGQLRGTSGNADQAHRKEPVVLIGLRIATACHVVVGETDEIARQKFEYIDSLAKPIDGLTLICEVLNTDFATRDMDEPFSDDDMAAISGWQTFRDRVVTLSGKKNPSVRDFVDFSKRARLNEFNVFIGSPKTVSMVLRMG